MLVVLVVLAQISAAALVRTHRVHQYLLENLERTFGRTVEVGRFNVALLPRLRLDAERVSIGEDPQFGEEYFLRAEYLTAALRWRGLLRGQFEFGTLVLSRPSLNLVRNRAGSWNLERWLPPAKTVSGTSAVIDGPPSAARPANRLQKIDVEDGRINFKLVDEKLPFAFTGVSGSVDQVSPGRWRLSLAAQPWSSGVTLQSTGTVAVSGQVAGTSARLQPAQISVHWAQVSLADIFRLFRGDDYGLRGVFALDGAAQSAPANSAAPGEWIFSLEVRTAGIHGWNLTERADNPRVNLHVTGRANVVAGTLTAERLAIETPKSNLRGTGRISISEPSSWEVRINSAKIQAADLLAWYRAFHPGVDERISADEFFTGTLALRGWPPQLEEAQFSSTGGQLRFPGLNASLRIGAVRAELEGNQLAMAPVHVAYEAPHGPEGPRPRPGAILKRRAEPENGGAIDVAFLHDLGEHSSHVRVDGHVDQVEETIRLVAQTGWTLNRGWELTGGADAALRWEWRDTPRHGQWNGHLQVTNGKLQVAGLNEPLRLNDVRMEWRDGVRGVDVQDLEGFGAQWSGTLLQEATRDRDSRGRWNFKLHADHLDAAELDRWLGPRSRPSWLKRLWLPILGGPAQSTAASEWLRRVDAQGQLSVDQFTMEKWKFHQVRAETNLRDLRLEFSDAEAQCFAGKVRAEISAVFSPQPSYEATAKWDRINLSQLPPPLQIAERLGGTASVTLHLIAEGVGRDELVERLAGTGEVRFRNLELRGWDVNASVADGALRAGASRWDSGKGTFMVHDRAITLPGLELEAGGQHTLVEGTISFARDADLTIQNVTADGQREGQEFEPRHVLKVSGPLDVPRVSVKGAVSRQPAS